MSKTGKIILWVVIAVIVIGGIWWWMASQAGTSSTVNSYDGATATSTTNTNSGTTAGAGSPAPKGDSSDQSINQDMTSLNAQMNGLTSDNASVTQSMNDQPVQQAQ